MERRAFPSGAAALLAAPLAAEAQQAGMAVAGSENKAAVPNNLVNRSIDRRCACSRLG
jgi:hypothetical protein